MKFPGFIGPSYKLRSVNYDCQRTINLYPVMNEVGRGKEQEVQAFYPTPGLRLAIAVGDGPIRGMWTASNGRAFWVTGNKLYELTYDGANYAETSRGTLVTSSGQVSITDNGIDLVLVDGANGYHLTFADNTFAQLSGDGWRGADKVEYIDGYLIFNYPGTNQFYISNLNSITIDPLDIASSEGSPDEVLSILAVNRELWVLNRKSAEVFFNSGDDFPFTRISGAFQEIGIVAPFSLAKIGGAPIWLGQDTTGRGRVYMAQGYQPVPVSTEAIDFAIQGYADISDATAFVYQQDGHSFYCLNFPTANTTWVFDTKTTQWHERAYFNSGALERHRGDCHMFFNGEHIVGDYATSALYVLDPSYYSDDVNGAKPILRRRISPHVSNGLTRVFHHSLEFDVESGVGDGTEGQGSDPVMMLDWSDDSGRTWSSERTARLGKQGETKTRVRFLRLGSSRDRVYRVSVTDPVKFVLLSAEINISGEAA